MRYLAWSGGILATFILIIYIVAFTSLGNILLKPIVENKIKKETKLDSKLNTFLLTMSDFEIVLELNKDNIVKAKGGYSLFSKAFDFFYEVDFKNLESLHPFTNTKLMGAFKTDGTVKGNIAFMKVDGKSNVGESDTLYHIELTDLNPTSVIASMKDAKLSSLLYLGAQNPYATGDIDLDINLKNINPHLMDGDIVLKTKNGNIDPKYMERDFNVTIPNTSFLMNLDAKLKGDDVDYSYEFTSNLFKINSSGKVVPEPLKIDIKYSLDIVELTVFKPIIGADVRGALKLDGDANGNRENLTVSGKSNLASSNTEFEALLKDFTTVALNANIDNLDLSKFLYMLKEPHYAGGLLSVNAEIKDLQSGRLDGKVTTTITKGILDSNYLTKKYEFKSPMPKTTFNSTTTTILSGDIADTKVDFNSNVANIDAKRARYNIKDGSLNSDYIAQISDLDKLFFMTNQHMRGAINLNGEFTKTENLDLTLHTKVADGKINLKLHNDDFLADINSANTKKLLYLLGYSELFDASLNAKINYNLKKSKGVLDGKVANCVFATNQIFDLIKQYTKIDMYRENFNGDIDAKIDKDNIVALLDLRSKEASIKSASAKLNKKTQIIDSDITIQTKEESISANLSGDANAPKVRVDLEKFLKSESGKKAMEKVNKLLKKLF